MTLSPKLKGEFLFKWVWISGRWRGQWRLCEDPYGRYMSVHVLGPMLNVIITKDAQL